MKRAVIAILIAVTCSIAVAQGPGTSEPSSEQLDSRSEFVWADTSEGRLGGRAYLNMDATDKPLLVIVLHGDLLRPTDSYHYRFAQALADQTSNAVVIGLLRPGYSDEQGNRSDGNKLNATGDNYTAEVVEAVAAATTQMKARYDSGATVLIGHSGGAAVAALLLGRHPEVADAALLIACPCDLPAWRDYMMSVRPSPVWEQAHQGLSPLDATSGVRATSMVELIVGDEDDVVHPSYSHDYAQALRSTGVEAKVTVMPGMGHNVLHRQAVINMANDLLQRVQTRD